jgi:hypothetical protein
VKKKGKLIFICKNKCYQPITSGELYHMTLNTNYYVNIKYYVRETKGEKRKKRMDSFNDKVRELGGISQL